jgi:threonine synthase
MAIRFTVECLDCGHRAPYHPMASECPRCGSAWRQARYDLSALGGPLPELVRRRPFDLWRYQELLPIRAPDPSIRIGEGGTPLYHARNLGMMFGLPQLYIKDERQSPTGSFKDRQAAVTVAALKEAGLSEAVIASTGNVAISYSAYCARAGIKLWAFLTSMVPAAKMHEVALYGTQVVKVTATYDQAKHLAAEFARRRNLYIDRGTRSIAAVESMKTLAFEIAEQLAELLGPAANGASGPGLWRTPDWYIQAVSGGNGPLGVLKGFEELQSMGLVQRLPQLGVIQTEGCSPMVMAWRSGAALAAPVANPQTYISTLSTGDPGRSYALLRQQMLAGRGGAMESVSDEEAFRAMHIVARSEGLSLEPAAAVAFAGLFKLARAGRIRGDECIVVNCSGHTLPVEQGLLAEIWSKDVEIGESAASSTPHEGLLAALDRLDERQTRKILLVDDHADARRLIRRVLQAQGHFEIFEVASGPEAIAELQRNPPDLLILDLMMPEMDGFAVLDWMNGAGEESAIPVIVVTAKELTPAEKQRLEGRIARLMVKGDLLNDDLLTEVIRALGD